MIGNSTSQNYDYTQSGIDAFLSRAIDQVSWQTTLESSIAYPGSGTLAGLPPQANSNNQRFDSTQTTGSLGDTFQVGGVAVNGSQGNITMSDGTNQFLIMGDDGSSSGTSG